MSWLLGTWPMSWMRRAIVKHYLSSLYQPDLSKRIVNYLELLHSQISVDLDNDPLNSYTSSGASDHVDHMRYSTKVVTAKIDKLVLLPGLV
ncbi:hypothetical protein J2P12_00945 [Candidatus Bathyarchaeota archaeon]|nr:hypothetical protein [Candidatus Bathyarchaeota archaeon]